MTWSQQDTEKLKTLWKAGHSDLEISRRLHVSPAAILGKRHRLKLYRDAQAPTAKPRDKLLDWNEPDANDPDHAIDARDFKILDAVAAGGKAGAVAKQFKLPTSYVVELWRVRQLQEPVGEDA